MAHHPKPSVAPRATLALVALAALPGCNLLLDFDGPRENATVGSIDQGDWIRSGHVGIALASMVDYLPDPEFDIVLSGSDPYQTAIVPIAPVGRLGDDGLPLTDAERVDEAGALSLDIPTTIEDGNRFGASLAYRDGLLLVGAPGNPTIQGVVRTYSPLQTLGLDLPFGADLYDPDDMDRRADFGISVAVANVDGVDAPDAIVGDRGAAWWFPGPAMLPDSFTPGGAVEIAAAAGLTAGPEWGAVVAGSNGSFSGLGAGDDVAVGDTLADTVDTFYFDMVAGALAAGPSYSGMAGIAALAFLDAGQPRLAVGAVDAGSAGAVFLCAPAGTCEELSVPDEAGLDWRDVGASLAAGDLNGDGIDDLVAGAPESAVDGVVAAGAAVVWFGDGTGGVLPDALVLRRAAGEENDRFGTAVAVAGTNLDDDACGEVAVGAPQEGGIFTKGLVLVFFELVAGGGTLPGASSVDCN